MTQLVVVEGPDAGGKSTQVSAVARTLRAGGVKADWWHHPRPGLHAPQEEIERRLRERGESIEGVAAQQAEYWRLAEHLGWPAVATTLPRERVTARLVQIVRGWL